MGCNSKSTKKNSKPNTDKHEHHKHDHHKHEHCHKKKCFCLCVPHVHNPSYSVEILGLNPILVPRTCCKCCKVKQHPFNQTVVVTPLPVSAF